MIFTTELQHGLQFFYDYNKSACNSKLSILLERGVTSCLLAGRNKLNRVEVH
jgi:hypothetical protein